MRSFDPQITLKQISTNTKMCVGASEFSFDGSANRLTFRVRVDNQRRYIQITLNGSDLYDVEQVRVRGGNITPTFSATNVFCEDLDEVVYRLGSTRNADSDWLKEVGITAS